MISTAMNQKVDNMVFLSAFYPEGVCTTTQIAQQQQGGEPKQRRRRKRNKGSDAGLSKKRKLTADQLQLLEVSFVTEHKLETERKDKLALELGLDPRQVAIWFQNRRARWKTQKIEEELSQLQTSYDNVLLEKCNLQSEVLMLKEELSEAKRRVQQLTEPNDGVSSTSPIASTLSMETVETPLFREFGVDAYEDIFSLPACPCNCPEWVNYLYLY